MVVAVAKQKFIRVGRPKEVCVAAVDWLELELAFRDATGTESFLDKKTGEVCVLVPGFSDEEELRSRIDEDPERFAKIQPIGTEHARQVMARFVETLPASETKTGLQDAMRAQFGVLSRCMELLRAAPQALNRYHRFEQAALWEHLESFLESLGVNADEAPPAVELFEVS